MTLSSSKEQFLREHPQYGYRDANADGTAELEIDRMRAQEFAHMQGTNAMCALHANVPPVTMYVWTVLTRVCICVTNC